MNIDQQMSMYVHTVYTVFIVRCLLSYSSKGCVVVDITGLHNM